MKSRTRDYFPANSRKRKHTSKSNDNGIRLVNFATSKNIIIKSTKFLHRKIHKYAWTSPDGITHNQINRVQVDKGDSQV